MSNGETVEYAGRAIVGLMNGLNVDKCLLYNIFSYTEKYTKVLRDPNDPL